MSKKGSTASASKTAEKRLILDDVGSAQAAEILEKLATDAKISKRIQELAVEHLVKVNPDDIAEDVFDDLNALEVEDLCKNSGRTRYGYVEPCEKASEMFEEELEPHIDKMRKCLKLSMHEAANLHCMGILKGIYRFEKQSTTEFADWVEDDPSQSFQLVFDEWKRGNNDPKNLEEMKEFVGKNFPEWSKDALTE